MVEVSVTASKIKSLSKFVLGLGLALVVICVIIAGVVIFTHNGVSKNSKTTQARQETNIANEDLSKGDKVQALKDAQKALADQPNKISNILLVANLTKSNNPSDAKQYYVQALDAFKQQNNLGSANTTAVNYWVAACFAQKAGENSQAKQYFQDVIKTASTSSSYEQSLAKQSQVELGTLQ